MRVLIALLLAFGCMAVAQADIWKWVDANGDTHLVDSKTPIYTWVDEVGDVHYSDTPGHEGAVLVQLIWVSSGTLEEAAEPQEEGDSGSGYPGETDAQRAEREEVEAYYCRRATEIYDSYVNAPQLYKTNEDGEREYLSKEEMARTIAETRVKKDEACR
ncbi:MAG: DUF4124 domain-containing protein [Gammaproteobacteria bacterium]|nr:DUF4124 domain-containing protein [Gammaproteobacteria bacterium]